ncbi:MAG: T9SS type A sorting domain-containing protein, partial [Bacteroidetes bacterium]|nr:T9SS type A sorting domain-containing protein [Bacteroidota bacterium]
LTVNQPSTTIINQSICAPDSYSFNGQSYSATGTYTATLTNAAGCDSVITLSLTVKQPSASYLTDTICSGNTYTFNGQAYTASGIYTATLSNAVGCDSVVTLNLIVASNLSSSISATICAPSVFVFGGQNLSTTGVYTHTFVSSRGCDSIVTLSLFVNQPSFTTISDTICFPNTYSVGGLLFSSTGIYTIRLTNQVNCDSVISLNLLVSFPGVITQQPQSLFVRVDSFTTFSVGHQNYLQFQWQQLSATNTWLNLSNNNIFSGVNTSTLRINTVSSVNSTRYRLLLTDCSQQDTSTEATLLLFPNLPIVQIGLGNEFVCPGQIVLVPITVQDFNNIGRIDVKLLFNSSILEVVNFTPNPALIGLFINTSGDTLSIRRNITIPSVLNSNTLMTISFRALSNGVSPLNWIIPQVGSSGIFTSNPVNLVHRLTLANGSVSVLGVAPSISTQPVSQTVLSGSPALFTVSGLNASAYQWQRRVGVNWVDLTNSGLYQGANDDSLYILASIDSLHNSQFRVILSGGCPPPATSQTAILSVTPNVPAITLRLGRASLCNAGVARVPLIVEQFNGVASLYLNFDYTSAAATFTGLSGVNTQISTVASSVPAANSLTLNWSGQSASLSTGDTLLVLEFVAIATSPIGWSTTLSQLVHTRFGQDLPRTLVNGEIVLSQNVSRIDPVPDLCFGSPLTLLTGFPAGGQFSGIGVSLVGSQYFFNPGISLGAIGVGTFSITYRIDSAGCTFYAHTFINVLPLPTPTVSPTTTICSGSSATLNALGGTGSQPYEWRIGSLSGSVVGTSSSLTVSPVVNTTYYVMVRNSLGCTKADSVRVIVLPVPIVQASPDISVCQGSSVTLNATGASTYFWSPSTGLNSVTLPNPVATPAITTQYVVVGISVTGCVSRDTVVVSILPRPTVIVANATATFCSNSTTGAQLEVTTPTSGVSYLWSPSTGLDNPMSRTPIARPTATTTYVVTVTDAITGCTSTGSVLVYVPRVTAGANRVVCNGSSVQLNANYTGDPSGGVTYLWVPPTGLSASNIQNPVASPTTTTVYTVTAIGSGGCPVSANVAVIVNPTPNVDAGINLTIGPGRSSQLNASITGGVSPLSFVWSPATGLSATNVLDPIASPTVTTMYYLTVTGGNGCSRTDSVLVTVDPNLTGFNVTGRLLYGVSANAQSINNASINLNQNLSVLSSTAVGGNGDYLFQNLNNGIYDLSVNSVGTAPGGITSSDAFRVFISLVIPGLLQGELDSLAADVDGNNVINVSDALLILQRSIFLPGANFARSWVAERKLLQVNNSDINQNIRALSSGDVDGDYLVPRRLSRPMTVESVADPSLTSGMRTLRLSAAMTAELGSMQLMLGLSSNVRVTKVKLAKTGEELLFRQQGNQLAIAWFTQSIPVQLQSGDIFLEITTADALSHEDYQVDVLSGTQFTDGAIVYLENIAVRLHKPISAKPTALNLSNYPNPFNGSTIITYTLSDEAQVKLTLTDQMGRLVGKLVDGKQLSGKKEVYWDASGFTSGVYTIELKVHQAENVVTEYRKLIVR